MAGAATPFVEIKGLRVLGGRVENTIRGIAIHETECRQEHRLMNLDNMITPSCVDSI